MIAFVDWLKGLFKGDPQFLAGTLNWTINWTDVGCQDKGTWLLYETESGKRDFEISHTATMTKMQRHPGYGDVLAWSKGGLWPSGARRTGRGENA